MKTSKASTKKKASKKATAVESAEVAESVTEIALAPQSEEDYFMTKEEHLALEEALSQAERGRLEVRMSAMAVENKNLELELLKTKIEATNAVFLQKKAEHTNLLKKVGDITTALKVKHGLVGDFQYDPTSGKIGVKSK